MAITKRDPNTVLLAGPWTIINDISAKEAITPGQLVELVNTSGVWQWQKAATAKVPTTSFAKDMPMLNKGVDDACGVGDLIEVIEGAPGATCWALLGSGSSVAFGAKLENAGNGTLKAWTDASRAFRALETVNNTAGPGSARIRVEVQ